MSTLEDDLERLWSRLLSQDATQVLAAWRELDDAEQVAVRAHLGQMADPAEGYADVQQGSAGFALLVLPPPPEPV